MTVLAAAAACAGGALAGGVCSYLAFRIVVKWYLADPLAQIKADIINVAAVSRAWREAHDLRVDAIVSNNDRRYDAIAARLEALEKSPANIRR